MVPHADEFHLNWDIVVEPLDIDAEGLRCSIAIPSATADHKAQA